MTELGARTKEIPANGAIGRPAKKKRPSVPVVGLLKTDQLDVLFRNSPLQPKGEFRESHRLKVYRRPS